MSVIFISMEFVGGTLDLKRKRRANVWDSIIHLILWGYFNASILWNSVKNTSWFLFYVELIFIYNRVCKILTWFDLIIGLRFLLVSDSKLDVPHNLHRRSNIINSKKLKESKTRKRKKRRFMNWSNWSLVKW